MKRLTACILAILLFLSLFCSIPVLAEEYASDCTPLGNSSDAKIHNIELSVAAIDGTYVGYGDTFSFNDVVGPRTEKRGYMTALNGRGVKIRGGGVAQTATTLYLALKQLGSDITYKEKKTYDSRFTDNYVSSGKNAIITDYDADTDFRFVNYYRDFTIRMWADGDDVWCILESGDDDDWGQNNSSGYASTHISGNSALESNITLCADSIYDTTLGHNDVFSFNDIVGPRTEKYGYKSAINGRGVKVIGGGVAQVASTIWLAIKNMDDVKVLEKSTYGNNFSQSYVSSKNDAIVTDYSAGTDFSFRYTGYDTMTIYTYVSGDEVICEVVVE